jgi:hypothetical protein
MIDLVSSKYTFVCDPDECDTMIELTTSDGFGFPAGVTKLTCPCGRQMSYLGCTILPTETKGNQMLDNLEASMANLPLSDAEKYNPNLLVTYKVINGYSDAEYVTDKVTSIEWDLHNSRQNSKALIAMQNKVDLVKSIIAEAYADSGDQETLREIAETLEIELTRTVEFTATVEVTGSVEIDLLADYGTDLESEVTDNLYVESQNGNIEIDEQYVTNVREN